MEKEFLRQSTCNQCKHGHAVGVNYYRARCDITKREGNASRACYCKHFDSRLQCSSDAVSEQGFKYRSKQIEDYRTEKQWLDAGFVPKKESTGCEMHASMMSSKTYIYYLPEDVEPIKKKTKCCRTCSIREGKFCIVAGDYISLTHCCSEWTN